MNTLLDSFRDYAVYGLSVLQRRWLLLCIPVALALPLSVLAIQTAPTKYTSKSLILLGGANRSAMGFGEQGGPANVLEQVRAIEAWVKSDEVLAEIIPRLSDSAEALAPAELSIKMRLLRSALSFDLVSSAVLEVRLEGDKAEDLGDKLEIILSRMMEGLTGPDRSILSVQQFKLVRASEHVNETEAELGRAFSEAGIQNSLEIRSALKELAGMSRQPRPDAVAEEARLLSTLSVDHAIARKLVSIYAEHENAQDVLSALQGQTGSARSNYVGIFNAPEKLLIIGRPKDPILGESSARKFAILGIFLSILGGGAIIVVAELMSGLIKTRGEYESVSGLPVVARLTKCESKSGSTA